MNRSSRALSLSPVLASLALAACGGPAEQTPPNTPAATSAPASTAAPTASATASAAPVASATASAAANAAPAKPTLRFWGYDGPAEGPAITGPRAWTAVPSGPADDRYRRVFISVEDFVKTANGENHFRTARNDLVAPVAMAVNLAPPASLKKGDPIMAESANDSAIARVVSVDGDTVTMKYVFGDLVGEMEAPKSEVMPLDGTLRLGAPVAFKREGKWYAGRLLAKNAQDAWVALHYTDGEPYVKVKAADVRAIDVTKVLKIGDKCVSDSAATAKNELLPGKITKVIEDGMFYEVTLEKSPTKWTIPFHRVSAPL